MARHTFPPGARVLVDGRDEARVRQAFPEGSSSYLFPHYKLDFVGGDKNVAVAMSRVGVERRPNASSHGPGSLHQRIAQALGWTEEQTQQFSFQSLRDLVRSVDPSLASEISETYVRGGAYVRGDPLRGRSRMRRNAPLGPGKFGNTLTRAIYELSLDGGADEEAGSTIDVGMWAAMIQSPPSILRALLAEPGHLGATAEDLDELRAMPQGGVILTEDTQGFVDATLFDTDRALLDEWREISSELTVPDEYESNARAGAPADRHAANELVLFTENTYDLWGRPTSQHISIVKNLMRKRKKGNYDPALSVKLWGYLAETAAKQYVKKMHSSLPWHEMFTTATRRLVAEEWAKDFREKADAGEYDHIDLRIGH